LKQNVKSILAENISTRADKNNTMRYSLALLSVSVLLAAAAPQLSDQQCVTTIGLPGGCCPPDKAVSETILVDCKGATTCLD
jgi:hypothetical protein